MYQKWFLGYKMHQNCFCFRPGSAPDPQTLSRLWRWIPSSHSPPSVRIRRLDVRSGSLKYNHLTTLAAGHIHA